MSKKIKCPNCGANVPADVKYCRKCHARLDSGRIENLPKPGRRPDGEDALRNLPRPVRPSEGEQSPQSSRPDGFFAPEQSGGENGDPAIRPERMGRMGPASVGGPRPAETARGGDIPGYSGRQSPRNLWQIVAVLALILVVIVVAVVLVIKLNQPPASGDQPAPSQLFTSPSPHVIDPNMPSPSTDPNAPPPAGATTVPSASPLPTSTPLPSPTPPLTPTPAPSATPNPYNITGINDTVYISGNGVNIRSGPGTNFEILGNESAGYELQRTGRTDNGWSRVYYKGAEAYVIDTLISSTKPATTTTAPAYTVTDASGTVTVTSDANLRTGPGTDYDIVTVAKAGTQLTRTGVTGNWTRVQYDGKNVFISTGLISQSGTSSSTQSSQVTITGIGVNVRTGPGTEYNRVGSVNTGDTLPYVGESGNWYQVTYNGQTCYVSKDYARLG